MTKEHLLAVLERYEQYLINWGFTASRHIPDEGVNFRAGDHMLWMCGYAKGLVANGRIEKAMRWCGFLQGAFWVRGDFTITELREHNRSTEKPKPPEVDLKLLEDMYAQMVKAREEDGEWPIYTGDGK